MPRQIFIDPSYPEFERDRLFGIDDPVLNRDGQLLPFNRLHEHLIAAGHVVHTAELLLESTSRARDGAEYYSMGMLRDYDSSEFSGVLLKAFVIMEPPVVAPALYAALPYLTRRFERVYVHNVNGDGYSLVDVDRNRLRKFYWPAPFPSVLPRCSGILPRQEKIVLINSKHLPRNRPGELYGKRIEAALDLGGRGYLDLYGKGWNRWRDKRWILRPSYWSMRSRIFGIYRGSCDSKYDILRGYRFCLCFENMEMRGYITEKILDCFYAGAVPLYLGATDIRNFVPDKSFVDVRQFGSWSALLAHVSSLDESALSEMRAAGAHFFNSSMFSRFYNSLDDILNEGVADL